MPFLLTSPPPPPLCHPTPKTSPNLPSFNISAFSTKPVSLNSVHNYGFQFLSHVRSSKTTGEKVDDLCREVCHFMLAEIGTLASKIFEVEGEIDKLSVEEAGFYNCASVPGGAPQTVSTKELPSMDKDMSFQYLWNSKYYLDKASRIILATDGDIQGQALAEELSRRLGKERCWQVVKNFGAAALRDATSRAKPYELLDFIDEFREGVKFFVN